ncbi:MAG: nucleoside triphosphate pyrophosphatase [Pseudomonadota bacterium]
MRTRLILASASEIRAQLLRNAGVDFSVETARVDEEMIKESLLAEGVSPRDIADALAEAKAARVSAKHPGHLVIGSDQVLEFEGAILSKPTSPAEALDQLERMSGKRHMLWSAAVIFDEGKPIWRHIGQVRMQMRVLSDAYRQSYVDRNWESIRHSVGGYKLEEEGVRLFSRVDGSTFDVLGFPLLEVLSYLGLRGEIET